MPLFDNKIEAADTFYDAIHPASSMILLIFVTEEPNTRTLFNSQLILKPL